MKKLFLTSIHPAPYIDKWIIDLQKNFEVRVFYNKEKSKQKSWKKCEFQKGRLLSSMKLYQIFKEIESCDIIFLSGWNLKINIFILIISFLLGKKRGVFSDYPIEMNKYSFKWLIKYLFLHVIVRNIFCATESTQIYYQKTFGISQRRTVLFPYATTENKNVEKNNERINALSKGDKVRFFVANSFYKRKGYDVLLKALSILDESVKENMEMDIAGKGEEFEFYSKEITRVLKYVTFHKWLENDEYEQMLQNCDVLIHASTFEPFGIPPIDAMKAGKLVVASDGVKSTNCLIKHGVNGYLFKAGDFGRLAKCISVIVQDKQQIYVKAEKGEFDAAKAYSNDFCSYFSFLV